MTQQPFPGGVIRAPEIDQPRLVTFSLATKLLLSVLTLLAVIIAFLNISAIYLLREDKRAYTYQFQSNKVTLAGREFVNTLRHEVDTLRTAMSAVDPLKPVTLEKNGPLKTLVENQSDLLGISLGLMDPKSGVIAPVTEASRVEAMKELQFGEKDLVELPKIKATRVYSELLRNSYAFFNVSRLDGTLALGILVADVRKTGEPLGVPVAFGLASLKRFGTGLSGLNLTIASNSGWILFDTDSSALFSEKSLEDNPLFKVAVASSQAMGTHEYDADNHHYLATYTHPGLELVVFSKTDWKRAIHATYELAVKFGLLGLMSIGAALILAIIFSKTITLPINRLFEATKKVAKGKFDLNLAVIGGDEISALTGSFNSMSGRIGELFKTEAEKIHLENEMAVASAVQQTLIPPTDFRNEDIHIHSVYQSASQCGGDWWGFFTVGRKMSLMIADATGHGMPSALITASARSCFSVMHKLAQDNPKFLFSPARMLSFANRVVYDASLGKIMMTFFTGVIDFDAMTLTYSSAGHNPPWLFKRSGDGGHALQSLVANGMRLGEEPDAPEFEERTVPLSYGDILFLYTDGLMEGKNLGGEMYGKKRVRNIVEESLAGGPKNVIETIMKDFLGHNEGKPLDDDVTLAVARIFAGQTPETKS